MLMSFLEPGAGMEGGSDLRWHRRADERDHGGGPRGVYQQGDRATVALETLMTSRTQEVNAAGKAVEPTTARPGTVAVETVQAKADAESTIKAVAEDTDFKANLAKSCASKQKEWDERQKLRAQELEAVSETIKRLNGDDALVLFKKTLPSAASLIQAAATAKTQMCRAKALITNAMSSDKAHLVNRHLMLMFLSSGAHGFEKVVGLVDGMVSVSEGEHAKDDTQDVWCIAELDKAKDEAQVTAVDLEDTRGATDEMQVSIAATRL